jgi:hypothetical protein
MELEDILDRSAAHDALKAAMRDLATSPYGHALPAAVVVVARPVPAVKVLRLLTQLLHAEPALRVRRVRVDAMSGCSDFTGILRVDADGETTEFAFSWDCRWRASEEGLLDPWGYPDQILAAQRFGWRCFAHWERRTRAARLVAHDVLAH